MFLYFKWKKIIRKVTSYGFVNATTFFLLFCSWIYFKVMHLNCLVFFVFQKSLSPRPRVFSMNRFIWTRQSKWSVSRFKINKNIFKLVIIIWIEPYTFYFYSHTRLCHKCGAGIYIFYRFWSRVHLFLLIGTYLL